MLPLRWERVGVRGYGLSFIAPHPALRADLSPLGRGEKTAPSHRGEVSLAAAADRTDHARDLGVFLVDRGIAGAERRALLRGTAAGAR